MADIHYLKFTVYLTDKATVDAENAKYPGGLRTSPDIAAALYSAPIQLESDNFSAPCIRSAFILVAGDQNMPTNLTSFVRKTGGWFGISALFGQTHIYKWYCVFAYASGSVADINGVPQEVVAIAQRKMVMGFENPINDGSFNANVADGITRDASRHPEGYGYCPRDPGDGVTMSMTDQGAAANTKTWERFYVRCRARPSTSDRPIWIVGAGANQAALYMTIDGRIGAYKGAAGVFTQVAVSSLQLTVGQWYRIDVELEYGAGTLEVFINRALAFPKVTFAAGTGIAVAGNHTQSQLGGGLGAAGEQFEIDFDDWIASEWATRDTNGHRVGLDWVNGSKVRRAEITGFSAGNTWTGGPSGTNDYRSLNNVNPSSVVAVQSVSTVTSAAVFRGDVSTVHINTNQGALGAVAFCAHFGLTQFTSIAGSSPTFGWKFNGLTDLAAPTNALSANVFRQHNRLYRPSGLTVPIANLTPLEIHCVKHGNVSEARLFNAAVSVELIGIFGAEDIPAETAETFDLTAIAPRKGIHVAPYPESQWARTAAPVISPVVVHSGTYVGNGTVTELTFRTPPTWLLIKLESGGGTDSNEFWYSSKFASNGGSNSAGNHNDALRALTDPAFVPTGVEDSQAQQYKVRLSGTANNVLGSTYNYIAFCDPGARYSMNGAFFHSSEVASFANALWNSAFDPDAFFMQKERLGADATYAIYYKGRGHGAANISPLSGAEVAGVSMAAGLVTTTNAGAAFNFDNTWASYAAFRQDDQSSDVNKHKVIKVGSYTGDGNASRTITWMATGLRPLYAMVVPHNAGAVHRTPSDTGTTSSTVSLGGNIAATGINGGGIDSFSVGSTLNANGVVYDWFVILGSPTAGNGGWSIDGEFIYVMPDNPEDGDDESLIEDPETDPPATDPDPDPGPDDTDDCADGTVCVEATTRVVNLAILELGATKILSNYCISQTNEAIIARQVYEQCVRHTLITYPWPFATKYATLGLTSSQPAANNEDWTYAYRMPSDCIFPRRFVVDRGTAVDPAPPPMGLSSDSSGGIIFGNEPDAVLEYTARPACVGYNGDDLFIEALKWRLAAAMAPALTRIPGEADRCLKMFEVIIQKAESTIKQGQPGLRGTASAVDVTAAAIAANIQVVNRALVRIGAPTIANMTTEQSRSAVAAALVFEDELRSTLRDYPWAFVTRYADPMTLVDGAEGDPATPDWTFSHRLPTDVVFVRRIVKVDSDWNDGAPRASVGRSFDPDPYPYRLSTDATGGLLYSNVEEPVIEYTARPNNILAFADPVFRDALAWRLAATLAPSLATIDPHRPEQHGRGPETPQDPTGRTQRRWSEHQQRVRVAQWAWAMYGRALAAAEATDHNESEPEPHGDAEWIRSRE